MKSHYPVLPRDSLLLDLPPDVQAAIRLKVAGNTNAAVGQRLGHDDETIQTWVKAYPFAVDQAVRELVDPSLTLLPLLPKALSRYHAIIEDSKSEALALKAAKDILLQAYGRPRQRVHIEEKRHITVEFVRWEDPQAPPVP